ncbi:MAG: ABC transporter ATP-binding protein [Zestosphaera sp.]
MNELLLKDVWFSYPSSNAPVLRGVTLELRGSELMIVRGPNGSGKSTLLLVAAGLLKPERGEVLLDGVPLQSQLPAARRRIGITFQNPDDQFFNATVYDEIAFALRQLKLSENAVRERVTEVAGTLHIESLLERPPYRLSGGEKVKVALASVLAYNPEILLLDEPTAYLTSEAKEMILRILTDLRDRGKAIVITTNDPYLTGHPIDKVYTLVDGRLQI